MNTQNTITIGDDSRGLSSAISFALLFGIVITAITLGTLGTLTAVDSIEKNTNLDTSEDLMKLVSNEVDQTHQSINNNGGSIEFSFSKGQLQTGEPTNVSIYRYAQGDTVDRSTDLFYQYETDPIIYRYDEVQVVYVNGAIIRSNTNANTSTMVRTPSYSFAGNDILYSNPTINYEKNAVGGNVDTTLNFEINSRDRLKNSDRQTTIEIKTQRERVGAWVSYGNQIPELNVTSTPSQHQNGTVTYNIDRADGDDIEVFETNITVNGS